MPRKKTTPNETDLPSEEPAAVPSKKSRKPPSRIMASGRKAAPRKRSKAGGGEYAIQPAGDSQLPSVQSQQFQASTADVARPAANEILDKAVSDHEQIALLAYRFWQERGGQWGSAEEDWLRAEQELRKRRESELSRG